MHYYFAPNNNPRSKFLFVGRTNDIKHLIDKIIAGNCIALYGERRSGKTLTLLILKDIVNNRISTDGIIDNSNSRLIDKTLLREVLTWKEDLKGYAAIYISLQGFRTEEELVLKLGKELNGIEINILRTHYAKTQNKDRPEVKDKRLIRLRDLLENLQNHLIFANKKIIILMDEMETLGEFKVGSAIAEELCKTSEYTEIIFIHTGSYAWKERVTSPGSLFTHLEPYFLRAIDEQDTKNFLLSSLTNEEHRSFVTNMSGCKPLYVQYIGKQLHEASCDLLELEILENISICRQIKNNIFEEVRLDEKSKKILAILAHHPNSTEKWIAEKLILPTQEVREKLNNLENFGTISSISKKNTFFQKKKRYRILGKFIELYGRERYADPSNKLYQKPPKSLSSKLLLVTRWLVFFTLLVSGSLLQAYIHPGEEEREFKTLDGVSIKVEYPKTLEKGEDGKIDVSLRNINQSTIQSLSISFDSNHIKYEKEGANALFFSSLEPNIIYNKKLNFKVSPTTKSSFLESKIVYLNEEFNFESQRRLVEIKSISKHFGFGLAALGFVFPGKEWMTLASFILNAVSKILDED